MSALGGGFIRSMQHKASCWAAGVLRLKRRTRIRYTDSQRALMWDRWQQGESLHQIARLFDRHHTSVRGILAENGGIRPPTRRRSIRALSLAEREDVSRALAVGQ